MNAQELLSQVRDNITVKRVFGDPVEKGNVTVLPVAVVMGGGGGGGGEGESQEQGKGSGWGGGFGMVARPLGVYVIKGDEVYWRPALDLNRLLFAGIFVLRAVLKLTRRRR